MVRQNSFQQIQFRKDVLYCRRVRFLADLSRDMQPLKSFTGLRFYGITLPKGGEFMKESKALRDQVFNIVDAMYNDLLNEPVDEHILKVLYTAATHLKNKKNEPAQVIAAKTVNEIAVWTINGKNHLGDENAERIRELMRLSRSGGYKWYSTGVGSLGVHF